MSPTLSAPDFCRTVIISITSEYVRSASARTKTGMSGRAAIIREAWSSNEKIVTRLASFSMLRIPTLMNIAPSLRMLTMNGSSWSFDSGSEGFCGRFTSTPCVNIGAVTMKITNKTNITSIYGTTLISDIGLRRVAML